MELTDLFVSLVILVGLVGIVIPVLPGSMLILAAVLVWTVHEGSAIAWACFAVATALIGAGALVKYTVPGRKLKAIGVPRSSLIAGGLLGIVGFFVIPIVGLILGFVLGVYLAEAHRVGPSFAWPSTRAALKAVGMSMLIELAAGLLATVTWLTGALAT